MNFGESFSLLRMPHMVNDWLCNNFSNRNALEKSLNSVLFNGLLSLWPCSFFCDFCGTPSSRSGALVSGAAVCELATECANSEHFTSFYTVAVNKDV